MPKTLLARFFSTMEVFRIALTRPSFENLAVVVVGWLLTAGTHSVTEALVSAKVAGKHHHEAFHRFFSRGRWNPDALGRRLFRALERFMSDGPLYVVIDDTIAPKKGMHVFGIGTHPDPVQSTRKMKAFCFGHCWVVLAVVVRIPLSKRTWALPLLFRLYRTKKETANDVDAYSKKTQLARELMAVFASWVDSRRVELAVDAAYCCDTVIRGLPPNFVLVGAMRLDAALTLAPSPHKSGTRGRPRKRGEPLPKPEKIAQDPSRPWRHCTAPLYRGRASKLKYKSFEAQWYRACGERLLRIVIVKLHHGQVPLRIFLCTDPHADPIHILQTYAGRWGIEVFFREAKQLLGFADSSARLEAAVRRLAPLIGLLYSLLVLWYLDCPQDPFIRQIPLRPWYRHKDGVSFEDILRTSRATLARANILDLLNRSNNLQKYPPNARAPANQVAAAQRLAA